LPSTDGVHLKETDSLTLLPAAENRILLEQRLGGIQTPTDVEDIMKQVTMPGIRRIPAVGDVLNLFVGLFWKTGVQVQTFWK